MLSFHSSHNSKNRSRRFPLSRIGCPVWNHVSLRHFEDLRLDSQKWNRISAPSLHACAMSKHMQPQPQMYPARQDPGPHSNKLMALQPQAPMAQGQLTTTGTQDVDLIPSHAQRMNMHEVLFCFDLHVNNITLECPLGSKSSGQRPTHQLSTSLSEFIAKQVPYPLGLYLKQELSVKTLWHDTKMMVFPTKLTVHFAIPVPISLSASPSHLRIEKLEGGLRPFEVLTAKLHEIFPERDTKDFSLSLHLMYVHKFLAFMIAGTVWENRFSNLHHPETNICLILLLLTGHLSSQPSGSESHGLWVMAALSPPRLFAAWRVEASTFRGFPVCWPFQLAIYLARCLTLTRPRRLVNGKRAQTQHSSSRTIPSWCYFYTALWLGPCQSILILIQHSDELDMACYSISPFRLYHMLASGTHVLWVAGGFIWRIRPIQSFTVVGRYKW